MKKIIFILVSLLILINVSYAQFSSFGGVPDSGITEIKLSTNIWDSIRVGYSGGSGDGFDDIKVDTNGTLVDVSELLLYAGSGVTFTLDNDTLTILGSFGSSLEDSEIPNDITITGLSDSSNWNDAFDSILAWDNGSLLSSYLTSSEIQILIEDSLNEYSLSSVIASTYTTLTDWASVIDDTTNWNTAYGWGDHSAAGYLTVEVDSFYAFYTSIGGGGQTGWKVAGDTIYIDTSAAAGGSGDVTDVVGGKGLVDDGNTGGITLDLDFTDALFLTDSITEGALAKYITPTQLTNFQFAYDSVLKWDNSFIYALIEDSLNEYSLSSVIASTYTTLTDFAKLIDDTTNWNTAYGWGDHPMSVGTDIIFYVDEDGDTTYKASDDDAGNVTWGVGSNQKLSISGNYTKLSFNNDEIRIGNSVDDDNVYAYFVAPSDSGGFRYNSTTDSMEVSHDGATWTNLNIVSATSGDITGVEAGNGLTGGGVSGDIALYLDTSKILLSNRIDTSTAGLVFNGGSITMIGSETVDGIDISEFIDQDVSIGTSPTFDGTNITGLVTGTVEQLHINARAGTSTIPKGNPIYATSYNAAGYYIVEIADASDPLKMPAIALAEGEITTIATSKVVVSGRATSQNTDTITDGAINSTLYVASGGGLTVVKPVGTNLIQKIGFIGRDHSSSGIIQVVGAGRTNDIPNVATIIGDWINTAYPWADNEVADDITASNYTLLTDFAKLIDDTTSWNNAFDSVSVWDNGALLSSYLTSSAIQILIHDTAEVIRSEMGSSSYSDSAGWARRLMQNSTEDSLYQDYDTTKFSGTTWYLGTEGLTEADSMNLGLLRINNNFTFPTTDGTANYSIVTDGSGVLSWGLRATLANVVDTVQALLADYLPLAGGDVDSIYSTGYIGTAGTVVVGVGLDAVGAVDLDYGSDDVIDHTFITDGTGTAEIVLPAGAIDGTEILDQTIGTADIDTSYEGVIWDQLTCNKDLRLNHNKNDVGDGGDCGIYFGDDDGTNNAYFLYDLGDEDFTLYGKAGVDVRLNVPGEIVTDTIIVSASLELPNAANPTTDAEGEIAWDSDDDFIEVYSGNETESAIIPIYDCFQGTLFNPDGLTDSLPMYDVGSLQWPGGIEIDSIQVTTSVDGAYALGFIAYSNADPPVLGEWIDTLNVGASDQKVNSVLFTDAAIEVGKTIYVSIPATDIDWVKFSVWFHGLGVD